MLPSDPNGVIGGLAIFGLVMVMFWRLVVWVRDAPVRPDPWDQEIAVKAAEAAENSKLDRPKATGNTQ